MTVAVTAKRVRKRLKQQKQARRASINAKSGYENGKIGKGNKR